MDINDINSYLQIAVISQGLILGIVFLFHKDNRLANRLLALFLLTSSVGTTLVFLVRQDFETYRDLMAILVQPLLYFNAPFIYFYTRALTGVRTQVHKMLIHFTPVAVLLIFSIAIRLIFPPSKASPPPIHTASFKLVFTLYSLMGGVSMGAGVIYSFFSFRLLRRYKAYIENMFSDLHAVRLTWLQLFLGIFYITVISTGVLFSFHLILRIPLFRFALVQLYRTILTAATIFAVAFFALRQPDIFRRGELEPLHEDEEEEEEQIRYEKQRVDEAELEGNLEKLQSLMESERPWLDEEITINQLAQYVGISVHKLSMLINMRLKQNFYSFINEYRVNEVKSQLAKPENRSASILSIAFQAGFNSKSNFNNIFKKHTGMTPSQYRREIE